MPNCGSAADESQVLPNRNLTRPISRMAGMPELTRYTVMSSTLPTVIRPRIRKMPWTVFSSRRFLLFML